MRRIIWACLSVGLLLWSSIATAEPLRLETVLVSARAHFPLIKALGAERIARGEELRAARGAFDTRLGLSGELRPEGFYENAAGDISIEQDTPLWGSKLFAGYRYGEGDFASYDGGRLTDESGELRVGVAVPILRDGRIDDARANIRNAEIALQRMDPEQRIQLIEIELATSLAYWEWVATGHSLEIAERLLEVARERQSQLETRVSKGAEARIVLLDNERLILERAGLERGAERDFETASIRLSLYNRDGNGRPVRPGRDRLPRRFPVEASPGESDFSRDLEQVELHHPILLRFANERERLQVEIELSRNRTLPTLDLGVEVSRDFGEDNAGIDERGNLSSDSRSELEVKAMVNIRMPVQQRKARGRLGAARIRLVKLENQARLARERIITEALQSIERLKAAYEQTALARKNVELAVMLRDAENRRLTLGLSNLIDVNIREIQAANAQTELVDAQRAFFKASAEYAARIARPPRTRDLPRSDRQDERNP